MTRTTSRRVVLRTVGAGIALRGISSGRAAANGDSQGAFMEQLATVLSSTYAYRDVDVAMEDGYEELGVVPEPPVGLVLERSDYFDGPEYVGETDLAEPPALLFYAPFGGRADGDEPDPILAGVEYTVSGDRTSDPPDLFTDEDASHDLAVTEEEGWHRSPDPSVHDVTGLHVWLYLDNPEGVFRKGHPLVDHLVGD